MGIHSKLAARPSPDCDLRHVAVWLHPCDVLLGVAARDGRQLLKEAAVTIGARCGLSPTLVFDALWRREQAGSTAIGRGFAVPHARIPGIDRPMTFYIRPKVAMDCAAPDGLLVRDVLVIVVPPDAGANEDHLQLLSLVARVASDELLRKHLRDASEATVAADAFRDAAKRALAAT